MAVDPRQARPTEIKQSSHFRVHLETKKIGLEALKEPEEHNESFCRVIPELHCKIDIVIDILLIHFIESVQ